MTPDDYAAACRAILDAHDAPIGHVARMQREMEQHRAALEAIASGAVRVVPADPPNDTSSEARIPADTARFVAGVLITHGHGRGFVGHDSENCPGCRALHALTEPASPVAPRDADHISIPRDAPDWLRDGLRALVAEAVRTERGNTPSFFRSACGDYMEPWGGPEGRHDPLQIEHFAVLFAVRHAMALAAADHKEAPDA